MATIDSIELKRPVAVKAIMTDDFRTHLINETTETVKKQEEAFKQVEAMIEQQKAANNPELEKIVSQFENEKARLEQLKKEMDWRVSELKSIPNDTEINFKLFEGSVTIKPGDNIFDKMSNTEVVIKDWVVQEIRGF